MDRDVGVLDAVVPAVDGEIDDPAPVVVSVLVEDVEAAEMDVAARVGVAVVVQTARLVVPSDLDQARDGGRREVEREALAESSRFTWLSPTLRAVAVSVVP